MANTILNNMSSTTAKPKPKPWEVNPPTPSESIPSSMPDIKPVNVNPDLPPKPESLNQNNVVSPETDFTSGSGVGMNSVNGGYRNIGYGGGGGMYGSGMYGSGMYGSGMYGGGMYGGGMYGGGMYGSGMYGMGGGANMNNMMPEGTQSAFQLIEAMIYTFTGFAQMLEATYMATHSSFFTMVSVAEQLQNFKEMIMGFISGGVLDVIKLLKKLLYISTGGKLGRWTDNSEQSNSVSKEKHTNNGKSNKDKKKKMALKPLIIFLAIAIGFPYLLNKYVTKISKTQMNYLDKSPKNQELDPNNVEFAKALYDYVPENPDYEADFQKGDFMAILDKRDALGNESSWWKVRTRKGKVGYVPNNYIEIIRKRTTSAMTTNIDPKVDTKEN